VSTPTLYYALLGANSGARLSTIKRAIKTLPLADKTLAIQAVSCAWEGQDGHLPYAPYINVGLAFTSSLEPEAMQLLAKRIERELGRERDDSRNAPIALDIDILLLEGATGIQELTRKNLLVPYCAVPLYEVASPRLGTWLMHLVRERESNWEALRSRLWLVAEPEDLCVDAGHRQHSAAVPRAATG